MRAHTAHTHTQAQAFVTRIGSIIYRFLQSKNEVSVAKIESII